MQSAPIPENEAARLVDLQQYAILDTPPEETFDDLTALAAHICGTPIALVSLIDESRQWFKAKVGINVQETPRKIAFCAHAIHGKDLFVVPDAAQNERFADNPLVTTAPNIRFYAGMPLVTPAGHALGTLCVIDRQPRQLTDVQQDALRRLGRQAVKMMMLGRYLQHEKATHASEERYRALFQSSRDAIMTLAPPTWQFTSGNPATIRMFGTQDEMEFLALKPWELSPERQPDGRLSSEKARQMIEAAIQAGSHFFEWTHRRRTGESFPTTVLLTKTEIDGQLQLQATVRDISNQKMADEMLRANEARLRCTLDVATDGLWDFTFPTLQAFYSPSWIRHLGLEDQDIPLNNVFDWKSRIHPDDRTWVEGALNDHLEGKIANYIVEHRVLHRSGEYKWFAMRGKVVQWDDYARPLRMMGTMVDITERKSTELELAQAATRLTVRNQELADAHAKALAATKAKSEFLASMSHEIRTPMNAIVAMADLLQGPSLSNEQQDYVGRLSHAATNLLDLINAILDLSKIEADQLELETVAFDLHNLLDRTKELMAVRAGAKQLELSTFVHPDVAPWRMGDPTRLRQVFVNLLGNAVKFTDHGKITVCVETDKADPHTLRCSVADTGIGIPSDKLDMIFENFSQVDSSITRQYGGTGLGLSICKRLVGLMRGEIGVASKPGVGSTFSFTVHLPEAPAPAVMPDAPLAVPDAALQKPPSLRSLRILLAEDLEDNRAIIRLLLKDTPYIIEDAENGMIAFQKFQAGTYDLVLMDMQMPVMDGVRATMMIREWEREQQRRPTPIVALTANAFKEDAEKSLSAGCTTHVTKPIKKKVLIEAIAHYANTAQNETA